MNKQIKQSILSGLAFSGTVLISFVGFAAYTNLATQTNNSTLTADIWNEMVTKINTIGTQVDSMGGATPSGAIMAFYLSTCPTGWIAANGANSTPDLRGTFIRGINGNANSRDIARTLGDYKSDTLKAHSHTIPYGPNTGGGSYALNALYNALSGISGYIGATGPYGDTETSPKNVALLYCMKQ